MDLVDRFLKSYAKRGTRRAYERELRLFADKANQHVSHVSEWLSADVITNHFRHCLESEIGSSVIRRRRAALKAFLQWIRKEGIANVDDALLALDKVRAGMVYRPTRHIVLSPAHVEKMLETFESTESTAIRDRAVISTIYFCCLRRSELVRIDVDHIQNQGGQEYIDIPGSRNRPPIFVKLQPEAYVAIEAMKTEYGITDGPLWRSFSNNSFGSRLSARSIHSVVRRAASRAGLDSSVNADTLRFSGLVYILLRTDFTTLPEQVVKRPRIWKMVNSH